MITSRRRRRTAAARSKLLASGVLATLWILRPGLPVFPSSLTASPTITDVEDVIAFVGWIILIGASLLWLADVIRRQGAAGSPEHPPTREGARQRRVGLQGTDAEPATQRDVARLVLTLKDPRKANQAPEAGLGPEGRLIGDAESAPARADAAADGPSVSVLGPLAVTGAKQSRGLRSATKELLAYLALRADGATADELIEALWPATDPRRARPRLWQAVAQARRILGDALLRDRDRYQLDRKRVVIDLDTIARLRARANQTGGKARREQIDQALELYRGEPLAGADYPWAEPEIRRLRADHVDLLHHAADARLRVGDPGAALQAAERGLTIDTLDEKLWRLAMQAEAALGMRESVTRRYNELRRILDERLGLEPDNDTRTLYRELLAQR